MMDAALFTEALTWSKRQGATEITILGGEPSLHPQFGHYLDMVRAAGLTSRVVTNGAPAFRDAIIGGSIERANVTRVAVSLDSIDPAVADRLRGARAHADAIATIDLLLDRGIAYDINVTATTPALDTLKELVRFADAHECRRVNVHWPSAMGLGSDLPETQIPTPGAWQQMVDWVADEFTPRHSDVFVEIERGHLSGRPLEGCALVEPTNVQVFPDGRVILCGLGADRDDWPAVRLGPDGLDPLPEPGVEKQLAIAANRSSGCPSCPAVAEPGRACIYDKVQSRPVSLRATAAFLHAAD